jgi:alkylation response protein AidB-like acyl-CoA dehydrogenase
MTNAGATHADGGTFRKQARSWLAANLEPRRPGSRDPLAAEEIPPAAVAAYRAFQRVLFDGGYAGIAVPTAYGGQGLPAAEELAFTEELAGYVTPDPVGAWTLTHGPVARTMLAHATPAFLREHIPPILSGERIWCQFYSEPEAGSDLAGIRTRATRDGDNWVLQGSKIWSSGASYADYAMCLARTDWTVPKHQGLTWFAVRTDAPGVTIRPIRQLDGRSGFCQAFLDDVVVRGDDIIGALNAGWVVTQTMLVYERGMGAEARAEPREFVPDLVALARDLGRLDDPLVRQALARAHVNDYVQHQLLERVAARLRGSDRPNPGLAAYGKLAVGTHNPIRARIAMEIAGPAGTFWRSRDEQAAQRASDYLRSRALSIAGGTNEMQRNAIGERVLGLPREPSFDLSVPFTEVLSRARNWTGKVG